MSSYWSVKLKSRSRKPNLKFSLGISLRKVTGFHENQAGVESRNPHRPPRRLRLGYDVSNKMGNCQMPQVTLVRSDRFVLVLRSRQHWKHRWCERHQLRPFARETSKQESLALMHVWTVSDCPHPLMSDQWFG